VPSARKWIGELADQAANYNVPFSMAKSLGLPQTVRRLAIIAGLVRLAHADASDEAVRDVISAAAGAPWPRQSPDLATGLLIGKLNAEQAAQFARHAKALNHGHLSMTIDDNGTAQFAAAA